MKRKLALLLALVMVISMLPMTAFAASNNSIDRVVQAEEDDVLGTDRVAPKLLIKNDKNHWNTTDGETFRLRLTNAEWDATAAELLAASTHVSNVERINKTTVQVTVYGTDGITVEIPMLAEVTDEGEATVTIESMNSAVTPGTYVFAIVADGSTIVAVDGRKTFSQSTTLNQITIDETSAGSFNGNKTVRLLLPRDFEFTANTATVRYIGGFNYANNSNVTVAYGGTNNNDQQELVLTFTNLSSSTVRGTIIIEGLNIRALRNASFGDVELRFRGDITSELVVAKYADYGVTVKADGDAAEIFAGRYDGQLDINGDFDADSYKNDTHELQTLVIHEDIAQSWLAGRGTTVEFPSWVKVIGYEIESDTTNVNGLNINVDSRNRNLVDIDATGTGSGRAKLLVTFYVSVEGDASGDITATVAGRSLQDEYEVVLGKALAPVEVSTSVTDVKLGLQRQNLGTITLSETEIGSIETGLVVVELEDGFRFAGTPRVDVDGDLRINQSSVKVGSGSASNVLTFTVTRQSDRDVSVIEISGIQVDLWRTLPEGDFMVYVGGDALVQNSEANTRAEEATFRTEWVAEAVIARVTTPAPDAGEVREEVKFTIGSTNYMVGTELEPMGVAPYIKDNRTFVPVTFVARALGMDRSAVVWNGANRTVTIFGERVVQMEIGSNVMMINGVSVTMDTAPEITMDRTFVPIAHAARALGVEYSWDQATQTVTFH